MSTGQRASRSTRRTVDRNQNTIKGIAASNTASDEIRTPFFREQQLIAR